MDWLVVVLAAAAVAAVADDDDADGSWNVQLYCRLRERAYSHSYNLYTKRRETEIRFNRLCVVVSKRKVNRIEIEQANKRISKLN